MTFLEVIMFLVFGALLLFPVFQLNELAKRKASKKLNIGVRSFASFAGLFWGPDVPVPTKEQWSAVRKQNFLFILLLVPFYVIWFLILLYAFGLASKAILG